MGGGGCRRPARRRRERVPRKPCANRTSGHGMVGQNMLNPFKRHIALMLVLTSFLSACVTAPGNYLDTMRMNEKPSTAPAPEYDVHLIDAQLIVEQPKI